MFGYTRVRKLMYITKPSHSKVFTVWFPLLYVTLHGHRSKLTQPASTMGCHSTISSSIIHRPRISTNRIARITGSGTNGHHKSPDQDTRHITLFMGSLLWEFSRYIGLGNCKIIFFFLSKGCMSLLI